MRALLVFAVAAGLGAAPPDADEIVRHSIARAEANWKAMPRYAYTERREVKRLHSDGRVKSREVRTFEVLMIEGSPYSRLIALNDEPLSPEERQNEQERLEHAIDERQREPKQQRAKRIAEYERQRQEKYLLMREMGQAFDFTLIGEDQAGGREVYVFEAAARPGYQPRYDKAKVLRAMRGRLWIDKKEHQWVKAEAEVTKPVSFHLFLGRVQQGTRVEYEQMPVENGVWLPKRLRVKLDARILLVKSRRTEEVETYSEYRRMDAMGHMQRLR